jgi:hypothetical protein
MKRILANNKQIYRNKVDKQDKRYIAIKNFKTLNSILKIFKKIKLDKYKNLKLHRIIQLYLIDLNWFMNTVIVYI